ncbi:MAG TPA: hypothetical protein VFF64_11830 [Candidatus Eremiobacteraceae bacterium]|nr:hypothetical protein [Candidatus Eremiobacteraceae bacterium]
MSLVLRRTLHFIVNVEQVNPERHRSAIALKNASAVRAGSNSRLITAG